MEDVSTPQNTDALSGTAQQNKAEQSASGNNFVVDDDDDDFMARIVDGTCRGIFSSSGNNEDDHDRPSLCHLPSCQLGENLNVLMVCSFFSIMGITRAILHLINFPILIALSTAIVIFFIFS